MKDVLVAYTWDHLNENEDRNYSHQSWDPVSMEVNFRYRF